MTYTGAMVLPQNAVRMQAEEMRYVEGGATHKWTAKAYLIKRNLRATINCGAAGNLLSGVLGVCIHGRLLSLIISNFTVGSWFNSWRNQAAIAYRDASKYGKNTMLTRILETGKLYSCKKMTIKKA